MASAAERWSSSLSSWALPEHIVANAPESPWVQDVATFAVDDTLDRESVSAHVAREVLPPTGGTVLDVGCGGGRSSLVLVPPATELIGVDQHGAMLDAFVAAAAAAGVARRTVMGSWPEVAHVTPLADVVVCNNVAYNVADIVPFVLALTEHARLAVVMELPVRHPLSGWNDAWRHFWGIDRPDVPTDADLVAVVRELGLDPEVWHSARKEASRHATDPSLLVAAARRRLCLPAERDPEIAEYLAAHPVEWVTTVATLRWPGEPPLF